MPVDDELFAHVILQFMANESCPAGTVFRIMHAISPIELIFTWPNDVHRRAAEKLVKEVQVAFSKLFPEAEVEAVVVDGPPARMILEEIESMPADFVVMGSHSRSGLARRVLGSVSHEVALHCRCPLAAVRPPRTAGEVDMSDLIFEGQEMAPHHQASLREHVMNHRFPLDGSDLSRLIQMRLEHNHQRNEPLCNKCLDVLEKARRETSTDAASPASQPMQEAIRHWFYSGGAAPVDSQDPASRSDNLLKSLDVDKIPMTPEEAELEWLAKRSQSYSRDPGKYWVSGHGEEFESGTQLPARLQKQVLANQVKDRS